MTQDAQVVQIQQFSTPHTEITDDIIIGKDILDLVTGAMYVDPLSIYREYVQNTADAIEEGRDAGLYSSSKPPRVELNIDALQRTVTIRDNGIGVPQSEFVRRLTAIGSSRKRGTHLRGFRGVGRLSGLGYCQELVFRSRTVGDRKVSEITWDGKKLKELLRSHEHKSDLVEAIRTIAKVRSLAGQGWPDHFYEVELRKLTRARNDVLLNEYEIGSFLAQVAPVPFSPDFRFGNDIATYLSRQNRYEPIDIFIGEGRKIFRPYKNEFPITDKLNDSISGITYFEVPGVEDGIDAIGWMLTHSYLGSIPKRAQVEGIRARIGNLQIGTSEIFAHLFSEPRFNSWCIGEVHILNNRIVPNGRRDDFEVNAHLQNFHGYLAKIAKDLVKICRDKSILRNRLKAAALLVESANQTVSLVENDRFTVLNRYLSDYSARLLGQLEALAQSNALSRTERELISLRSRTLSQRLDAATRRRGRRRDPLSAIGPAKRRAYEAAIEVVLTSNLPITIRAELTDKIIRRARSKTGSN